MTQDPSSALTSGAIAEHQLEAEFLWQDLEIGNEVLVEFSVYGRAVFESTAGDGLVELLSPGRWYLILDKRLSSSKVPQFITESNLPGRPVTLYPHCICSYRRVDDRTFS